MIKIILALAIGFSAIGCGDSEPDEIEITNGGRDGDNGRTGRDGRDGQDGYDGRDGKDGKGNTRYVTICLRDPHTRRYETKYIEASDYVADYLDKAIRYRLGRC